MNPPPGPWRPNPVLTERVPRPPKRLLCRLFGCRWEPERLVPEDDPRWDRTLWKCGRCGEPTQGLDRLPKTRQARQLLRTERRGRSAVKLPHVVFVARPRRRPPLPCVAHSAEGPDRPIVMLDGLGLILERGRTLDTLTDHTYEYAPAVRATVEGHIDGPGAR